MRAWRLRSGELRLEEMDDPALGPDDVRVRVRAVSLNYRDLMVVGGRYAHGGVRDGLVPCSDGAGEVVEVGARVDRVAVGDRVAGLFMPRWQGGPYDERYGETALGGGADGVLAERVVLNQDGVVRVPSHLGFEEAATLPCAAVTAWNALFGGRPLQPGESVLVEGSGGVSLFALAFARMAGARPIATTTRAEKRDRLLELGADAVVALPEADDWAAEVRSLTGGRGVDHVVEVVGGGNVAAAGQAVRNGGQIHLIGAQASGQIDPTPLRRRNVVMRGVYVGSRADFEAMNRAIEWHRYRPVVDRVFGFEDAAGAFAHLRGQGHVGKVVIASETSPV